MPKGTIAIKQGRAIPPVSITSLLKKTSCSETLVDVIKRLSLAKDLETVMFIVRKAARALTGADGATFVLRDGNQCYYADEDAIAPLWKGKRFPMNACVSGWVMEHSQPIAIEDIYQDPRVPAEAYRPTFVKSLAMVPIRSEFPIGAIGTYWAEPYQPTPEQVDLLKTLADSTSIAIENIQLHSEIAKDAKTSNAQTEMTEKLMEINRNLQSTLLELNRRNEEMAGLKDLGSLLQSCLNLEEAYQLIAQYTVQLLPDTAGTLYLIHPSRNYLEAMVSWGKVIANEKIIQPHDCLALRRGSVYKIADPKKDLVCGHYTAHTRTYSCIPLFAQSDIIGLLYLEWKRSNGSSGHTKSQADILASTIAEQISIGLSNIKLRETLKIQSIRDTLTGLYNRRYLEETLERDITRCKRKGLSLALLMLDIDHFKRFNDEFGHEAGDQVIHAFARTLKTVVRQEDIVCRYGGEEFIIVMPEVKLEAALRRAKKLHQAVQAMSITRKALALPKITMSIGLALYPDNATLAPSLIEAADKALYQAKNTGRNKTVVFEE